MGVSLADILAAKAKRDAQEGMPKGGIRFPKRDEIEYLGLEEGIPKVMRGLGNLLEYRVEGSDPKLVRMSWCRGDKKSLKIIWDDDIDWFLSRVYRKVMEYEWDNVQRVKKYKHVASAPHLFLQMSKNGKKEASPFETGWKPQTYVLMNVLDREDKEWHKREKHSKVLSKKMTQGQDGKTYYEEGVPESVYKMILDRAVEERGWWGDFDVAITKLRSDPYYEVISVFDKRKISDRFSSQSALMTSEPLTEEERAYKLYDFDELYKVTPYAVIARHYSGTVDEVDKVFGTKFSEELRQLVGDEREHPEASKGISNTEKAVSQVSDEDVIPF